MISTLLLILKISSGEIGTVNLSVRKQAPLLIRNGGMLYKKIDDHAVVEVLSIRRSIPLEKTEFRDTFEESGALQELLTQYHLKDVGAGSE